MPQSLVTTRPERSSDQIAADRKAANAFFARYDNSHSVQHRRDIGRLVDYFSYDWKLLCCEMEAREWAASQPGNAGTAERAKARATRVAIVAATEIPARDDSKLRPYVHASTSKLMRPVAMPTLSIGERLTARGEASSFWRQCEKPSPEFRARALRDREIAFVQWLLTNPEYGPLHDAPQDYTGTMRPPIFQRYKKGVIRPAGMTYQRALEIAIAVHDAME